MGTDQLGSDQLVALFLALSGLLLTLAVVGALDAGIPALVFALTISWWPMG